MVELHQTGIDRLLTLINLVPISSHYHCLSVSLLLCFQELNMVELHQTGIDRLLTLVNLDSISSLSLFITVSLSLYCSVFRS